MIVCSCNVLTEAQIRATLKERDEAATRSPFHVYRCLGCKPNCGRCLVTVKRIMAEAREDCDVGCATCPGLEHEHTQSTAPAPYLVAAE